MLIFIGSPKFCLGNIKNSVKLLDSADGNAREESENYDIKWNNKWLKCFIKTVVVTTVLKQTYAVYA